MEKMHLKASKEIALPKKNILFYLDKKEPDTVKASIKRTK